MYKYFAQGRKVRYSYYINNANGVTDMNAIANKTNKRGIQYALVQDGDKFGVYKLCENYCRHVKGGMAKAWRYVEKGMTREAAQALFDRRSV